MAHIVKNVLASNGFGRLAGKVLMAFVLVGAMAAVPLAAFAQYDDTDSSDGPTQDSEGFGSFGDVRPQGASVVVSGFGSTDDDAAESEDDMDASEDSEDAVGEVEEDVGIEDDGATDETVEPETGADDVESEAIDAVEDMTGTDAESIDDALDDLTLAEYAAQFGVSEDQLVSTVVAEIEANIALAVANGELTQEGADAILAGVTDDVTSLVNADGLGDDDADDGTGDDDADDGVGEDTDDGFGSRPVAFNPLATVENLTGASAEEIVAALNEGQSLSDFAAQFGVGENDLFDALAVDLQAHIAASVESGFLTQEQADEMLATLKADVEAMATAGNGTADEDASADDSDVVGNAGSGGDDAAADDGATGETEAEESSGGGQGVIGDDDVEDDADDVEDVDDVEGAGHIDPIGSIAEITGTTPEDVMTALAEGQTLAEFSEANGVSADVLVSSVLAEIQMGLDEAVAAGHLTQLQADEMLANITGMLTSLVNGDVLGSVIGADDPGGSGDTDDPCDPMPADIGGTGASAEEGDVATSVCPADGAS